MLARAQTSNALTRAGRLGVLGLATLVSTSTLVWAQHSGSDPHRDSARPLLPPDRENEAQPRRDHPVHRDAAERLEAHLKSLAERLGHDVGPVGEEIRKAIEEAAGTVNETLKKENLGTDDLREALEKAGEELHRSFREGGPIDREAREAWEKAQDEFRATLDRAREDAREALRYRYDRERDRLAGDVDEDEIERRRDEMEGRTDGPAGDELSRARDQVREIQRQLRAATRNLEQLERREARPDHEPRRERERERRGRMRPPAPPAPPSPPSPPEEPAPPDEPAARRFFRGPGGGPPSPRVDRRLDELESKLDRLLEELNELKKNDHKDNDKKDKDKGEDEGRRRKDKDDDDDDDETL